MRKELFDITGMSCSACSSRVQKAVSKLEGVSEASVNLLTNSMAVSFEESVLSANDIEAAVVKAGYGATLHRVEKGQQKANDHSAQEEETAEMKRRLWISVLFTVPLFYVSMGHMMGLPLPGWLLGTQNAFAFAFTQFLLTIPVIGVNFKYYRVGFKTLFAGAPNMDSLIGLGSGAATLFGVYALYKLGFALGAQDMAGVEHFSMNLYFESAAMILTLITLGKFFEARAKSKTSDAIAQLMNLAPKKATVLRDGVEVEVADTDVRVGDILVVKAGESIPVDGEIVEGSAYIDESALTGESIPSEKQVGDTVTGASFNRSGHILMKALRVGDDTTLSQIIRLMESATSSKAPIARLADTVSGYFVPVVIVIAILSTAIWLMLGYGIEFALSIGIAVLVISCPCALGLATPTAIMVGMGQGARHGILIKSAQALEVTGSIDTVVLDKTGTVTQGKPLVTDVLCSQGVGVNDLLIAAASLEKLSEHPLGDAIVAAAQEKSLLLKSVRGFQQTPGEGIQGDIDGVSYYGGNRKMLKRLDVEVADEVVQKAHAFSEEGKTALYFVKERTLLGVIALADTIKQTSFEAVSALKTLGVNVIMLTGDNARTAAAVQRKVGIDTVIADVLPQDKEREIRTLQSQGKKVVMVGDGINDAPALARADVGMAIGAGTDIAMKSADIVLMKSDLRDVANAIELSRAVMRNIRQNLFWAFFYNSVGIPVAAGVFFTLWGLTLNPMIAAAAMSLSSVSVVSNALRLRFFKPKTVSNTERCNVVLNDETVSFTEVNVEPRSSKMKKVIHIEGMRCSHCSGSVEKALRALAGVSEVTVDLEAKTATVIVENVSDETLSETVRALDFEVTGVESFS